MMTPNQYKRIARLLKELRQALEQEALKDGVAITSSAFNEAYETMRTNLLEQEGFALEQYQEAANQVKSERETKKSASEEKADQFFERVEKIRGDKGETGDKGEKGDKGERGEKGDKGEPGKDGKDGRDGKDGKDGTPGPAGTNGRDGEDVSPATVGYLEDLIKTVEAKVVDQEGMERLKGELLNEMKIDVEKNIDIMGMPDFRKLSMGIQEDVATKIQGVNTHKLTVSSTEPTNPQLNDLWVDIS